MMKGKKKKQEKENKEEKKEKNRWMQEGKVKWSAINGKNTGVMRRRKKERKI